MNGEHDHDGHFETMDLGGMRARVMQQADGSWVAESLDRQLPRFTADSLADLREQAKSMLAELGENEPAGPPTPEDVRTNAHIHGVTSTGPIGVSEGDLGTHPVVPGEDAVQEDWED